MIFGHHIWASNLGTRSLGTTSGYDISGQDISRQTLGIAASIMGWEQELREV
jgi:hypothetical protein